MQRRWLLGWAVGGSTAAALLRLLLSWQKRRFFDGLDNIVGYSSKLIAAARALETQRGADALVSDPLAELLAGPKAMAAAKAKRAKSAADSPVNGSPVQPPAAGSKDNSASHTQRQQQQQQQQATRSRIILRTLFCDDVVLTATGSTSRQVTASLRQMWALANQAAHTACTQVCLLGAGMDTRAWRLPLPPNITWFEVDQADVLVAKRALMTKAGAMFTHQDGQRNNGKVHLKAASYKAVAADLQSPGWSNKLADAGFDTSARTLWVLEGLLYYLQQDSVPMLLKEMSDACGRGSMMAASCVSRSITDKYQNSKGIMGAWTWGIPGEDKSSWPAYFANAGWQMVSAEHYVELADEYGITLTDRPAGQKLARNYSQGDLQRINGFGLVLAVR